MIKPLVAVYVLLLTFINSQRIYEVILEASSVVFSGTDDTLWFRLCNDIGACGRFQEILGGLSTDQLFSVNYTSNIDLGALLTGSLSLLTTGGDQLCLSDIYVEGNNYDAGLTPYCIDADDNIYPRAECEVLTVNFAKDVGSDWDIDSSNPCSYTYEYNQTTTVPPIDEYSEDVADRLCVYSMATYCSGSLGIGAAGWDCEICLKQPQMQNVTIVESVDIFQNSAQGFVGYDPIYGPSIVIAFAGTDPLQIEDWITDLSFTFLNYSEYVINSNGACNDCQIHKGFYESYVSISTQIWDAVAKLQAQYGADTKLVITGHSLGGAMATHCAIDAVLNYGITPSWLYTFGAPRIGNDNFVAYYANIIPNLYRVTYKIDPVPHLPLQVMHYRHLPNEIYYPDGWDTYITCDGSGEDPNCQNKWEDYEALDVTDHLVYMGYDFTLNFLSCKTDLVVAEIDKGITANANTVKMHCWIICILLIWIFKY